MRSVGGCWSVFFPCENVGHRARGIGNRESGVGNRYATTGIIYCLPGWPVLEMAERCVCVGRVGYLSRMVR
jgi:hypothetical protein